MSATITDPLVRMRYLIARSATFRTLVGATAGAEAVKLAAALARVYAVFAEGDVVVLPFATVEWGEYILTRQGMGGGCFTKEATLSLKLFKGYGGTTVDAVKLELITFNATTATLIDELAALSGASTHLVFQIIRRTSPPYALPPASAQHWMISEWQVSGIEQGSQTE